MKKYSILDNFQIISNKFNSNAENLCRNPCQLKLQNIISCQEFKMLVDNLMSYKNFTESHISVIYLFQ